MRTVSVIIPTWNRAALIEKAIRSALEQTAPVLEVLVCDDGSTDNTEDIVKNIGDDRVRWVNGARGGRPAIPRNRGLRECAGEWVAFLDSDDLWLPEKLEKQLDLAEKLGCLAVCSNGYHAIPGNGTVGRYLNWDSNRVTFEDLLGVNRVICSSAVLHRSLLHSIEGFPEDPGLKVGEDYSLWLRVATQTDFAFVPEPLIVYLDDAANSVRCDLADELMTRVAVCGNFIRWGLSRQMQPSCLRKALGQAAKDFARSKKNYLHLFWKRTKMSLLRRRRDV